MSHAGRDDDQIHVDLYSKIAGLTQRVQKLYENQSTGITINIEAIIIGGNVSKLNTTALNAALVKNTSIGDVLDSIYDAIVEAINGANGQAEIDALVAKLESDNFREETRVNALKGLVTPAPPALSATWNGPTTGTVGASFSGAVAAAGGTAPYSYTQDSGALPDGCTFASDGSVSGAPGSVGEFSFGGSVTDVAGSSATWSGAVSVS